MAKKQETREQEAPRTATPVSDLGHNPVQRGENAPGAIMKGMEALLPQDELDKLKSPKRAVAGKEEPVDHVEEGRELLKLQDEATAKATKLREKLEKSNLPAGMISHIIVNDLPDEEIDRMIADWNDNRVVRRAGVQWGEPKN